jgi:hypothetical protein
MRLQIQTSAGITEKLSARNIPLQKALLFYGILSSVLYVSVVIIAPFFWENYDRAAQSVSELFAIGAPSASFVTPLFILYAFLIFAFGVGIWMSAGGNKPLKAAAALIIAKEIFGLVGTIFGPMHLRGAETGLSDTIHAVVTAIGVLLCMFPAIGFGAASFGRRFRIYSIVTMAVFIVCGVLAGMQGPNVAENLPTPYLGVLERINIYTYMLWIVVLSTILLKKLPAGLKINPNHSATG